MKLLWWLLVLSPLYPFAVFGVLGQECADTLSYHVCVSTHSPGPVATPTPVPCLKVVNPPSGASVTGTIKVTTVDTCPGVWFETLYVDGKLLGSFVPGLGTFNSTTYTNGPHTLMMTSQSQNPNSVMLGCAVVPIYVSN